MSKSVVNTAIDAIPGERWYALSSDLYIALTKILDAHSAGDPITREMMAEGREAQGEWDGAVLPIMEAEHDAAWGTGWRE